MFGSSGAAELAYANVAITIALVRKLVAADIISKEQSTDILDDAARLLGQFSHVIAIAGAIRIIQTDVKTKIAA